jgi:hypothetical protein
MEWADRSPACPLCFAPLALADPAADALLPRPAPAARGASAPPGGAGPGAAELEAVLVRLAALHGGGGRGSGGGGHHHDHPRAPPLTRAVTAPQPAAPRPSSSAPGRGSSLRTALTALSSSLVKGLGGGRRAAERR